MTAYDYDRQRWSDDKELYRQQLEKTRTLLLSERGKAFAEFTGDVRPISAIVADIDSQLAAL